MSGKSILKTKMLSHCACEVVDIAESRKLFEDVLGLEIVAGGPKWLDMRLNSTTTIACVETKGPTAAGLFSHFGLQLLD